MRKWLCPDPEWPAAVFGSSLYIGGPGSSFCGYCGDTGDGGQSSAALVLHFRHACIDLLQEFQKLCYLGIYLTEGVCGTANGLVLIRYNTFGLSGNLRSFVSGNLNLFDDPGDLTGGVQGLIRQLLDLLSDHCEASSGFSGSGSFNGSVKGQKVGLLGNLVNSFGNGTDGFGFSFSLPMVSTMLEVICMVEEVFSFRCSTDSIPVWIAAVVPVASALIWSECEDTLPMVSDRESICCRQSSELSSSFSIPWRISPT